MAASPSEAIAVRQWEDPMEVAEDLGVVFTSLPMIHSTLLLDCGIQFMSGQVFGTSEPFFPPPTPRPTFKPTISPTLPPSMTPTDVPTPKPSQEPSMYFTKAPAKDAPTDFFSKFEENDTPPEAQDDINNENESTPSVASKVRSLSSIITLIVVYCCSFW